MLPSTVYSKYAPDCMFAGKKVLNFGCGLAIYKAPNVVNLDCTPGECITVVPADQVKLPFEDNSFDLIIANHVMEHLPNWFETMKEFARIIKVGGQIEIWVPPVSSDSAFTYRDHINCIGQESFAGCSTIVRPGSNLLAAKEFKTYGAFSKLKLVHMTHRPIVTLWSVFAPDCVLNWMIQHLRNIVSEEGFFFIKGE